MPLAGDKVELFARTWQRLYGAAVIFLLVKPQVVAKVRKSGEFADLFDFDGARNNCHVDGPAYSCFCIHP